MKSAVVPTPTVASPLYLPAVESFGELDLREAFPSQRFGAHDSGQAEIRQRRLSCSYRHIRSIDGSIRRSKGVHQAKTRRICSAQG